MNTAKPDPSNVQEVFDVLREAGFSSASWRPLGRKLLDSVRPLDLDAIEADHLSQGVERCLEKVISGWIRDGENSWEKLVDAVRQCLGGGKNIADKISQMVGLGVLHRHEVPRQGSGDSAFGSEGRQSISSPLSPQSSFNLFSKRQISEELFTEEEVKESVKNLNIAFNGMVVDTQDALDASGANPRRIVSILRKHDAQFSYVPREFFDSLNAAADVLDLFARLDDYWDHFNYHLLERLILLPSTKRLFADNLKNLYDELRDRMIVYIDEMKYFRKHTAVDVYCNAVIHPEPKSVPADFEERIEKCDFKTLQDVEEFRQRVAYEYKLREFLVFLKKIEKGSVIITLWIPKCATSFVVQPEVVQTEVLVKGDDSIKIIDGVQVEWCPIEEDPLPHIGQFTISENQLPVADVLDTLRDLGFSAAHWRKLGMRLVSSSVLSSIAASHSTAEECLERMITEWRRGSVRANWQTLAEAIAQCHGGRQKLKMQLLKKVGIAPAISCTFVKRKIRKMEKRFNALKKHTRECLKRKEITVKRIAYMLMILQADDEHVHFLKSNVTAFFNAANHSELFGALNFHLNYLNPHLLEYLTEIFDLVPVKGELEAYKKDLQRFRERTPLATFGQAQKRRRTKSPAEFREVVAEFKFEGRGEEPLQVVEQFKQEYASQYGLRESAMKLSFIEQCPGSFTVTWFIPESVVDKLKTKVPRPFLKHNSVLKLNIAGVSVYRLRNNYEIPKKNPKLKILGDPAPSVGENTTPNYVVKLEKYAIQRSTPEPRFVEEPPEDFHCPVTCEVMLQPHLTECCGNHISKEALLGIEVTTKKCPICNSGSLKTMLNKHFQRQIMQLRVFCHYEEKECTWQGPLSELDRHMQSCPKNDSPAPATEPQQQTPVNDMNFNDSTLSEANLTPMTLAVKDGKLETVVQLLESGEDPNPRTDAVAPLMEACNKENVEITAALLRAGADPNVVCDDQTPLLQAAKVENRELLKLLIDSGADPNVVNNDSVAPLMEACNKENVEIAAALLRAGADPNVVCSDRTPLLQASKAGNRELLQLLIDSGADPNAVSSGGLTALLEAAYSNQYESVDILLENGAIADMQDDGGWSALMEAVYRHYDRIALRIIEAGVTPHLQDKHHTNALLLAIATDEQDVIVEALLDCKPELDLQDSYGETALIFACKVRNVKFVRRLLSMGANPNIGNNDRETPVLIAVGLGEVKILKYLLERGASAYLGVEAEPPLLVASSLDSEETAKIIVDLLTSHGAAISQQNEHGITAHEVAEVKNYTELAKQLKPEQFSSSTPRDVVMSTVDSLDQLRDHLSRGPLFMYKKVNTIASLPI